MINPLGAVQKGSLDTLRYSRTIVFRRFSSSAEAEYRENRLFGQPPVRRDLIYESFQAAFAKKAQRR
jgi:hypothetical protein